MYLCLFTFQSSNNEIERNLEENTGLTEGIPQENSFTVPKPTFNKRKKREEKDTTSEEALQLLKNMYEARQCNRNEIDAFGEYVAMKLKEVKNDYARNTAQYHINNILFNACTGEYDWHPNMRNVSDMRNGRGYSSASDPSTSKASYSTGYTSAPSPFTSEANNSRGYTCVQVPSTSKASNSIGYTSTSSFTAEADNSSVISESSQESLNDLLESLQDGE